MRIFEHEGFKNLLRELERREHAKREDKRMFFNYQRSRK